MLRLCLLLAPWAFCAGCAVGPSDAPQLAKVSGLVTLDQEPLSSGLVKFIPDTSRGTQGPMALGAIQPDGTYQMTTLVPGDGTPVGYHLVSIECYEIVEFDPNNPKIIEPKSLIPERYQDHLKSGLSVEVEAGLENAFDFELESK